MNKSVVKVVTLLACAKKGPLKRSVDVAPTNGEPTLRLLTEQKG